MGATGCDDAPLIEIIKPISNEWNLVTMIYPYYDNPRFLARQIRMWNAWPVAVRRFVSLIVVDDCSPGWPAAEVFSQHFALPFYTRLFRTDKDVRWNWLAARNIGAYHAGDGWLLLTDMDHVVPVESMRWLTLGEFREDTIYRFSRTERGDTPIHPHPNSWFMTRAMFWKVGGYDERMSGYYGSDGYYRRRCAATAPIRIMSNVTLDRFEHDGDSSTIRYKRKQAEDAKLRPLVRSFPPGSKPLTLSFPYHEEDLSCS